MTDIISQIKALCHTLDRGVGYRVSGDHSTWDSHTEGKSDFAGEVLELIGKLEAEPPTDDEREALDFVIRDALAPLHIDYTPWHRIVTVLLDAILASPPWRNRHRGPITDADALRFGKIAWVAYQEDKEWAVSVVNDCFSPADDLPEEALNMIAVARAVLEAAEAAQ